MNIVGNVRRGGQPDLRQTNNTAFYQSGRHEERTLDLNTIQYLLQMILYLLQMILYQKQEKTTEKETVLLTLNIASPLL